ncbi:MAG: transposase [Bacteroidetes bacterium]|nr:MAG: transposase [Bacteroidota bacterium]RLD85291.1 MAG: transposase [Bacteroidota bacterium]HHL58090.1 transposase [Bacteroidota bacterium]
MSEKYKFRDPDGMYFVTMTITGWVDIFTKSTYCDIFIDSLKYCQNNKGLVVHAWVIMSNHVHLIISKNGNLLLSAILRDLKRFTSVEIIKTVKSGNESRKKWMLEIFAKKAAKLKRVNKYKVWKDGNHPIEIYSNTVIDQKLDYLHNNPVKAGIVYKPEEYVYSSAVDYAGGKGLIDVVLIE